MPKKYTAGHRKEVFGLFSELVRSEYLRGETPQLGTTFINQFMKVRSDFPVNFRPLDGSILPTSHGGGRMVEFVLVELGTLLKQVGLYHSVRTMQYGLPRVSTIFVAP